MKNEKGQPTKTGSKKTPEEKPAVNIRPSGGYEKTVADQKPDTSKPPEQPDTTGPSASSKPGPHGPNG